MNKKILAAAIAASIAAPMAVAADVTVYGKVHNSVDAVDFNDVATPANNVDNWQVNDHASRLGVKGSEDLGNGLKANFNMEFGVETTDKAAATQSPLSSRNAWAGISGDFGEFRLGIHDTPAKIAKYAGGVEMLGDSIIDMDRDGLFTDTRSSNAIAYITPNMSGFQAAGAMVPGEGTGVNANDGIADTYSLGGWYSNAGLKLSMSYESVAGITSVAPEQDAWGVWGSYNMDAFTVAAGYENTDDLGNVAGAERDSWILAAKFVMGNNEIMANYIDSESENAAGATVSDVDSWGIAAVHNFSKRTNVYVAYEDTEDDGAAGAGDEADRDTFSIGLQHSF